MRIGILADSHGRAPTTATAVAAVRGAGAELILHLGDVGSEAVVEELVGCPARIVFGNCDLDERRLTRAAESLGITVDHPLGDVRIDGKRIMFTHGHLPQVMTRALAEGPDYLLHGHTHELLDQRRGTTRIINPGALFRASRYTAAVLEPAHDRLRVLELGRA